MYGPMLCHTVRLIHMPIYIYAYDISLEILDTSNKPVGALPADAPSMLDGVEGGMRLYGQDLYFLDLHFLVVFPTCHHHVQSFVNPSKPFAAMKNLQRVCE